MAGSDDVPSSRSFGTFRQWFDCQFHSTLLGLADEPLIEKPFYPDLNDIRRVELTITRTAAAICQPGRARAIVAIDHARASAQ